MSVEPRSAREHRLPPPPPCFPCSSLPSICSSSLPSAPPFRAPRPPARPCSLAVQHDSLVVPAALPPARERLLTVGGGAGQHRYSRFGRSGTYPSSSRGQQQQQQWSEHGTMASDEGGRCCSCCGAEGRGRGDGCGRKGSSQGRCGGNCGGWKVTSQGFGVSPFPAVDSFLRSVTFSDSKSRRRVLS